MKKSEILLFEGELVKGKNIYNPTAPFLDKGKICLAARVEPREKELQSQVIFFDKKLDKWEQKNDAPIFNLQDPFITKINGYLLSGGVKTYFINGKINWKTIFYLGQHINELEPFAEGPNKMKDIRLVELPDSRIGLFTRPRGGEFKKGKIGFKIINKLEDLLSTDFYDTHIFDFFDEHQWGGANEAHVLNEDCLGVIGHIAHSKEEIKHYYAMCFELNYRTMESSRIKIIAKRKDFPKKQFSKTPALDDIVFPGGILLSKPYSQLYVGISDAYSGKISIPYPFDITVD